VVGPPGAAAGPEIDASFPGGNIIVEQLAGDLVTLRQDLRDTEGDWFYWCFRVRGAAGRSLTFRFTGSDVIGVRGPAASADGGRTWRWLGRGCVRGREFVHSFAGDAGETRFSMGMPYQQSDLERFLGGRRDDRRLVLESLCRTAKGRAVERLRFGRLDGGAGFRVLLACRHHACEMMANYVLEGIIGEALSGSEAGRWLASNVEFAAIPFVDKDGVEDGDQGKNRRPHDHGRDYGAGASVHRETAALREWAPWWLGGRRALVWDIHCPGPRGRFHEEVMLPVRLRDAENWRRLLPFLQILEQSQSGALDFRLADSEEFTTWDGQPHRPDPEHRSLGAWAQTLPGVHFTAAIEIPYANARGREVNQESARAFGADLAGAFRLYLQGV